ncbi:MAG: Ig domain-containing protein [Blastocatellia bacterium]|nr:Ig domain-containing protein [Blastocatellia bacterium]
MSLVKAFFVQLVGLSLIFPAIDGTGFAGTGIGRHIPDVSVRFHLDEETALDEGNVGKPYEHTFQAEGGLAPFRWKVVLGNLPPGVILESDGKLSGTPTQAQQSPYRFVVEVADSSQPPQTFAQAFSLTIKAAPLRIKTNAGMGILSQSGQPQGAVVTANRRAPSAPPPTAALSIAVASNGLSAVTGGGSSFSGLSSPASSSPSIAQPASPPASCSDGKVVICGRLRPASIDQSLALIQSLPSMASLLEAVEARRIAEIRRIKANQANQAAQQASADASLREVAAAATKSANLAEIAAVFAESEATRIRCDAGYTDPQETRYLVGLWERIADSRFDHDCSNGGSVANGAQKAAVAALLQWLLRVKYDSSSPRKTEEIRKAFGHGEFTKVSDETIRKQIKMLSQYLGNVAVTLEWKDGEDGKRQSTMADKDGNFKFEIAVAAQSIDYTISTDADNGHTRVEGRAAKGTCTKVNLSIEDRPVSLLVRSVIGRQQAAATSTQPEWRLFFDFFIRSSFPMRQKIDPDFGESVQLWSALRVASAPQPSNISIKDTAANFKTDVGKLKLNEVAQVFDYLGGVEWRIPGFANKSLLPSFAGDTKQKFSLSFIASYGFVTVPETSQSARVYQLPANTDFLQRKLARPAADFAGKEFIAFVDEDRDRFFRQYYAGFRAQTFFFNRHDVPMQRFPAQFDIQFGQNEYVTGGRLHGTVLRFDGYFPLPFSKVKFVSMFGTAIMRPVRAKTDIEPLLLKPILVSEEKNVFDTSKIFDPKTLVIGTKHFNRDYYKFGVGVDLISAVQSIFSLK